MAVTKRRSSRYDHICLSGDTKPTANVLPLSIALETDTNNEYVFNGSTWVAYTKKVDIASALPAGTNLLGKVGIDQTTPGTTNAVSAKFIDENGTPYGVKHVSNKPRISSMPYLYDIVEGNVADHTPFTKLGFNGDVGTTEEDVWTQGGVYVFPTSAMQMEVVSTSVEDDILTGGAVAGTGVHKVKVSYLDNTYAAQTEEVTLNGTAAVLTSATNILRVNALRASVVGTNKKAVGLITIRNATDHTTVYRSIQIGGTRGREMIYTVPLGKTLYITSVSLSSGYSTTGKNVRWTARANLDDVNMTILDFFMPYFEIQTQDATFTREFELPMKIPATCDLKVSAISDSANSVCTCAIRGWTE